MKTNLLAFNSLSPGGDLNAYVQTVSGFPILTADEEKALAERFYYENDLDAARKLVLCHLRFVVHLARSYAGYGLSHGDLIQEGNVGLMKAVKRYNPEVGVRLVSFAVHWIKAEMHEFILRNWRIVKVATTKAQRKLFFNLRSNKNRARLAESSRDRGRCARPRCRAGGRHADGRPAVGARHGVRWRVGRRRRSVDGTVAISRSRMVPTRPTSSPIANIRPSSSDSLGRSAAGPRCAQPRHSRKSLADGPEIDAARTGRALRRVRRAHPSARTERAEEAEERDAGRRRRRLIASPIERFC